LTLTLDLNSYFTILTTHLLCKSCRLTTQQSLWRRVHISQTPVRPALYKSTFTLPYLTLCHFG